MKILVIVLSCFLALFTGKGEVLALYYGESGPPGPDEVQIAEVGIIMPLGKILLVRRASQYCAVKFTEFQAGKTKDDLYAKYESCYQDDGTGDFSLASVQRTKGDLLFPKPRGIGRLAFSFGNKKIKCGPIGLFWTGGGSVHFYGEGQKQGDYGIELAPTPWTDISQVDVRHPRIKWYRYDAGRKRVNISIDKLWDNTGK
jgi:hypothetical protein